MNNHMKQSNLALLASIIFLALVAGGVFWLWQQSKPIDDSSVVLGEQFSTVEITSVKERALELTQSKGNLSQMPIKAPTDLVGRVNPFAGI